MLRQISVALIAVALGWLVVPIHACVAEPALFHGGHVADGGLQGGAAIAPVALTASPTEVKVGMTNKPDGSQSMSLSPTTVHAGSVLFRVANESTNTLHEFLVVRTDLDPSSFPLEDNGSKVDEKKLKGVKELGDLEPGTSGQLNMLMKHGRYVLFCNQPGHFKAGMVAILNVAP
jgi:uncharacterized cupredoxin-like copper-binding protein